MAIGDGDGVVVADGGFKGVIIDVCDNPRVLMACGRTTACISKCTS